MYPPLSFFEKVTFSIVYILPVPQCPTRLGTTGALHLSGLPNPMLLAARELTDLEIVRWAWKLSLRALPPVVMPC